MATNVEGLTMYDMGFRLPYEPSDLWKFLPLGYLFTISIETPVLMVGLAPRHSWRQRLLAGVLLTACTYPIVTLVMPPLLWEPFGRPVYLAVAETFAPLAEILIFTWWTRPPQSAGVEPVPGQNWWRDAAAILIANLASFLVGEAYFS